jgi:hypothetical protein
VIKLSEPPALHDMSQRISGQKIPEKARIFLRTAPAHPVIRLQQPRHIAGY